MVHIFAAHTWLETGDPDERWGFAIDGPGESLIRGGDGNSEEFAGTHGSVPVELNLYTMGTAGIGKVGEHVEESYHSDRAASTTASAASSLYCRHKEGVLYDGLSCERNGTGR